MSTRFARAVIRLSARLVNVELRKRWREEWLAEFDAMPESRRGLAFAAGAPWDALSSRWTTHGRVFPRVWPARTEWRQASRSLSRAPWFAASSAAVIALSMAFTTTIFAVVDGVLFKPLPYPQPDQLFSVTEKASPVNGQPATASPSPMQLVAWREALPDVRFGAYTGGPRVPTFILKAGPRAEKFTRVMVGEGFWETLGQAPMFGRFAPEDFAAQVPVPSAIVSYDLWQRWCGGDPAAIGRSIVDERGSGIRVVGVLPRDFIPPWGYPADLVTPLVNRPASRDRGSNVLVRAPAGMSDEQIAARVSTVNAALAPTWPISPSPNPTVIMRSTPVGDVALTPLRTALTGETRAMSWLVLSMALCLMAVGCLNVSGLAAARLEDRWRDLVLRRALGAGSVDLARLVAIESAIVVGAGTAVGVMLSAPLLRFTGGLMSDPTRFLKLPALDWRVLSFSALVAAAAVLLISLGAARGVRKANARAAIADGTTSSRRGRRAMWSVASAQVALACVLAVGGALVAGSLVRVWHEDPGFDPARTARINITPPQGVTASEIEQLMADLRLIPGVANAGGTSGDVVDGVEFTGSDFDAPPHVPTGPPNSGLAPGTFGVRVQSRKVTNGYLQAAGLAVLDGRLPTREEFDSGTPVLIVSETVAREYWPNQAVIGQTLMSNSIFSGQSRPFAVIGIVADARYAAMDRDGYGAIYYPTTTSPKPWLGTALVRLDAKSPAPLQRVVTWLQERCPRCTIYGQPMLLEDLLTLSIRPRRLNGWLFGAFGLAAVIVVGAGILGLVAMTSARRTKEIGIRLTLGATPAAVIRQIVREQVAPVIVGLVAGGLAAAWSVQYVKSYLYKLPVYDFTAWAAAIGALLAVAILGALIPSVRASRLDPVRALRVE